MDIVQVVKDGAQLTGEPKPSPLFPLDWKPAVASEEDPPQSSVWRRKALQARLEGDDSHDTKSLHEATLEEVRLGHLAGPFSEQQLDKKIWKGKRVV